MVGFHKILCPTDFSESSKQALVVAVRLAISHDAELVIEHAWHLPPLALTEEVAFPAATIQQMVDDEERALAAAVDEARQVGAKRVTSVFARGVPWDQIVETARHDVAIDLIVMGTHGRTGFTRILLGSVAENVIRHAPCSVLAVRGHAPAGVFKHVLCPVDFSPSSRYAAELAVAIAEPGGAGVVLLHVLDMPVGYLGDPMIVDLSAELDRHAERVLEAWSAELCTRSEVPVTISSRIGRAGPQILAALEADRTFDLVVLGSHGRTGLRRVLIGSVAEKTVRHAPCPVLIARPRQAS
jgi:nucleotide-binding universal stress UspA family protein